MYFIDKEKEEILKQIKDLTSRIYKLYLTLKNLESLGKKESNEYKNCLNILSLNLLLENSLYSKLGNNPIELSCILEELTFVALSWDLDLDFILLIQNHEDDLVDRRIILKICDKINKSQIVNPITPLVNEGVSDINFLNHTFTNLSVAIRTDFINTFLYFLNIEINSTLNESLKNRLINLKYNIGFIYEFIEEDFISHNFSINPELYWTSPLIAYLNGLDEKYINDYQKEYASKINRPIYELCSIKKKDLINEDVNFFVLVYQLLIRVAILFGKEEHINKIKDYLNKSKLKNMNTASFMINEALDKYLGDKDIPVIVNFKLNQ